MTLDKTKDRALWVFSLFLFAGAIFIPKILVQYSPVWRNIGLFTLLILAVFTLTRTLAGVRFLQFWQASVAEVRKAVWPTRQETTQTTLAVLVMVFLMSILLWTVDFGLLKLVATLTGRLGN